jgi:TldD protein
MGVAGASLFLPAGFAFASGGELSVLSEIEAPKLDDNTLGLIFKAASKRGAEFSEVYLERSSEAVIEVEDGELTKIEVLHRNGAGIRAWSGEKQGFATTEVLTAEALIEAAEVAASIAKAGSSETSFEVAKLKVTPPRIVGQQHPLWAATFEEQQAKIFEAYRAAKKHHPNVVQVKVALEQSVQGYAIYNSEGLALRDLLPMIRLNVDAMAQKGTRKFLGRGRSAGRQGMEFFALNPAEKTGKEAAEQAVRMLDAQEISGGEMTVVLSNMGGVLLHEAVGHGLEGDAVSKGHSYYAGRVGEKVASEIVTVIDDPSIPNLRGSFNADDEGLLSKRKILIDKGVLRGFLWDKHSAKRAGKTSNGNGRRESFADLPQPRMTNTFMDNGSSTPGDVIRSVKKGFYAKQFGGGEVDTTSGDFTFTVTEGYLIENGELTTPVRGASLVGQGSGILQQVDMVANDLAFWVGTCGKAGQWVPVTAGCPTLRIKKMLVGGFS